MQSQTPFRLTAIMRSKDASDHSAVFWPEASIDLIRHDAGIVEGVVEPSIRRQRVADHAATGSSPQTSASATIAALDTVQAVLSLQTATIDPKTHTKPATSLVTTVRLNNCSLAASGQQTSCF